MERKKQIETPNKIIQPTRNNRFSFSVQRQWPGRLMMVVLPRSARENAAVEEPAPIMVSYNNMPNHNGKNGKAIRFIDLFCGIGGFRIAAEQTSAEIGIPVQCVFSSDIDEDCQRAYEENFGEKPAGDITAVKSEDIPDHDILLAGFPCQPFSIIGNRKGFEDTRGTLFFEIARILEAKKPTVFVLENVKLLAGHNNGKTLKRIMAKC